MGAANGTLYNMSSSNWLTSTVPVVTANAPGRALSFDGTDNHVVLNKRSGLPIYNSGTAYSVSMWVKGDAQTGSCLYRECDPGAGGGLSLITTGAGKVQVGYPLIRQHLPAHRHLADHGVRRRLAPYLLGR
jgi:hypothetical protein